VDCQQDQAGRQERRHEYLISAAQPERWSPFGRGLIRGWQTGFHRGQRFAGRDWQSGGPRPGSEAFIVAIGAGENKGQSVREMGLVTTAPRIPGGFHRLGMTFDHRGFQQGFALGPAGWALNLL
jgi:hypothetical protein